MIVVVEEDDVEVGGVAELLAAQLAVGDDGEARRLASGACSSLRQTSSSVQVEHDVGQLGEVVGQLLHAQQAGQVLRQQAEHLGVVGLAHQVHLPLGVRLVAIEVLSRQLGAKAAQSGGDSAGGRRAARRAAPGGA
jgi:hypothetical protein